VSPFCSSGTATESESATSTWSGEAPVLKVADIAGSMLVSAAPDFAPSRLSKTTDSADAEPTSPKSQTAAAAQAAIPVRERIGCPQHNKCRLIIVARAIGESQAHYLGVSGCGERWSDELKCVAKDRQCAFRPPRESIPRGLFQRRRNARHVFRQRRTGAEREPFAMTQAAQPSPIARGRTRRESIVDAGRSPRRLQLAAKPPMPPFSARP
jgi:hypothetical protein